MDPEGAEQYHGRLRGMTVAVRAGTCLVPQVVLADNVEENQHVSGGVSFAKLGPFSLDGTFLAYRPGSRTVEPCKV